MNVFATVKKIIDEWDPIGLLELGCPEEEYDLEVKEIIEVLPDITSPEELADHIREIMYEYFGIRVEFNDCLIVANKLYNLFYSKYSRTKD